MITRTEDLNGLIKRCLHELQKMSDEKQITIYCQFEDGSLVQIDAAKIEQVVTNLLMNAIKFTPVGGEITVKSSSIRDGWRFELIDSGAGMSKEDIEKINNEEPVLSHIGTAGEKGTGYGLIVCKELLKLHDKRLSVECRPDHGCCFSFVLNVADSHTIAMS